MRRSFLCCFTLLVVAAPVPAQTFDRARITAAADSIVGAALKDGRAAGVSLAVVRGRDTLLMKGYGFLDLELDVPTNPRAVYEIGSVTKQFTAAAILQLHEQGKLSLDDDLSRWLPDYPTHGKRITIRRLMDHTSGIKGYTEMPSFRELERRKLSRDTLVKLVAAQPFEFEPGEGAIYNNSAYFLLGLIIEKASGMKYEEYVQKHLFEPAGMRDSRYCSENAVVKNRAKGYDFPGNRLVRAAYLDHTWPYAAGSLCSTAGDLVAWNRALHGGKLLSPASYRELITPGVLNDGTRLRYAKGISTDSVLGRRALHHGGGIYGFSSYLIYFPNDSLHIVSLVNTAGPVTADGIARQLARTIYGPGPQVKPASFTGNADDYVGTYQGPARGGPAAVTIGKTENGGLTWRLRNGQPVPMVYLGGEQFAAGNTRATFVREDGKVTRIRADFGSGFSTFRRTAN